jgi:phosphonopyruvate decarboxylase
MMQNSGLGNAVSPLTSLTWTFRLPQLLIVAWRGQPGGAHDEPQHALMGPITPQQLELMEIPWELFPEDSATIAPALERATRHMDASGRPYAFVMCKDAVAPYALGPAGEPAPRTRVAAQVQERPKLCERPTRQEILRTVLAATAVDSSVLLASTGLCGRELYALDDRPNQLYMVGSMGCVQALALGVALSRPQLRVIALDGDGAALMRMGSFATIGAYAPANLWHLLIDNGAHDSTGGQATVSASVAFAEIAAACGYATALQTSDLAALRAWLRLPPGAGPHFACIPSRAVIPQDLPRPADGPEQLRARFSGHLARAGRVH